MCPLCNYYQYIGSIYSTCSSNSEGFASKLIEHREEMFLLYQMHDERYSSFKSWRHNNMLPVAIDASLPCIEPHIIDSDC